jgi:hypothetical protein
MIWRSALVILTLSVIPASVDAKAHQILVAKGAESASVKLLSCCGPGATGAHVMGPVQVHSRGKRQRLIRILDSLGPGGKGECDLCNVWYLGFHYRHRPTEKLVTVSSNIWRHRPRWKN